MRVMRDRSRHKVNVRGIGIRANRIEIFAVFSPVKRMKKTMKRSHRAAHLNVVTVRYGNTAGVCKLQMES